MLISDVLRRKGQFVATISPAATVRELLDQLAEHNIGAVVVVDDDAGASAADSGSAAGGVVGTAGGSVVGSVIGIVSERDVVRQLRQRGVELLADPVSGIMTRDVRVTSPEETVESLMAVMTEARIRHVPVLAEQRLVGIVSIGDVVKSRMEQLESERESLIGYVSGG